MSHRWKTAIGIATGLIWTSQARPQAPTVDVAVVNLPRPGYEPLTLRVGSTVIAPLLDLGAAYNDNIAATRTHRIDDAIFNIRPRVDIMRRGPTLDIRGDVHADFFRFASNTRENVDTFGAKLDVDKQMGPGQELRADAGFDRTFERRSDPEADFNRTRPPALINLATGDLRYSYKGPQIGLTAQFTVIDINYLRSTDADRDLTSYRASLRGLYSLSPGISAYVEGFATRRDNRVALDRSGFDRDTTTAGGLAGLQFDLTGKLTGDIGVGVFDANPDDRQLRGFTGVAASGRLSWRPRQRTEVMLDVFRGDVASVRVGAIGRVDTRASLSIDQEARHNLILHASAGLRDIHYRGTINRDQRYAIGEAQARYLLVRHIWVTVETAYTHRAADFISDRFHSWQTSLGLRATY